MAHEDIAVSEEWQLKILEEIGKADIFICVLSKNYINSPWCVQESGIASFRKSMTVVPLSLDGTIPLGFISNVQSAKIDPSRVWLDDLIPGFLKHSPSFGLDIAIDQVGRSASYRGAEANFQLILTHHPGADIKCHRADDRMGFSVTKLFGNSSRISATTAARPPLGEMWGMIKSVARARTRRLRAREVSRVVRWVCSENADNTSMRPCSSGSSSSSGGWYWAMPRARTLTTRPWRRRTERRTCCSKGEWKPLRITLPACTQPGISSRVSNSTRPGQLRDASRPNKGSSSKAGLPTPWRLAFCGSRPTLATRGGKGRLTGLKIAPILARLGGADNGDLRNTMITIYYFHFHVSLSSSEDNETANV